MLVPAPPAGAHDFPDGQDADAARRHGRHDGQDGHIGQDDPDGQHGHHGHHGPHGHQGPIIELLTNAAAAWQHEKPIKAATGTSAGGIKPGPDSPLTPAVAVKPDGGGVDFSLT